MNQDLFQLLADPASTKPLLKEVVNCLKAYEEEYRQLCDFLQKEIVTLRSNVFKAFLAEGFSREEAMTLTLVSIKDVKEFSQNYAEKVSR